MKGKLLLIAGIATGYVIGARAGRPAYDAVVERAERLVSDPHVRDVARGVAAKAEQAVPALTGAVTGAAAKAGSDAAGAEGSAAQDAPKGSARSKGAGKGSASADAAAGSASSRTVDTAALPGGADETSTS